MSETFKGIKACVFDAYGTLFDVNAAARHMADEIGGNWPLFSQTWRDKQLQYTWLRAVMKQHVPFWQVTQDALDFALEAADLAPDQFRQRLLDLYFSLDAYPEVPKMLTDLKAKGLKTAILCNGSPDMLDGAVSGAKLGDLLDQVLSVEDVGVFKPDRRVYQMVCDQMGVAANEVCFQSSNGWDAQGAKEFGFNVVWVNRASAPAERMPWQPDLILPDLTPLAGLIEAKAA